MAPEFRDHDGPDGKEVGIEEDERMMRRMYELFPGIKITIEDIAAEGDKVVCRKLWRWMDGKSGAPMEFHSFVEWRIEGDKIAERWATVTFGRSHRIRWPFVPVSANDQGSLRLRSIMA